MSRFKQEIITTTRRGFVKGIAVGAAGLAAANTLGALKTAAASTLGAGNLTLSMAQATAAGQGQAPDPHNRKKTGVIDGICHELSKFAVKTKWEDLPADVVHETKVLLLDSIGCAIAGVTSDPGKMAIAMAKRMGGPPESSIIGVGGKVSCNNAVFANGQLINTIDFDAMTPGAHTPPYVIPPPLALAESAGSSGKDLILATALGFEIAARVQSALPSGMGGAEGGWAQRWGQAGCSFGAAAGAGKILNLDEEKMSHNFGIAGHLCQVPTWIRYTFAEHRSMAKYGVPGWQNTGSLMAALLAEMGFIGDTTLLDDHEEGFWKFNGFDGWNPEGILDGIGSKWNFSSGVRYKPYPSCSMFQTELSLFYDILQENKLMPDDIESVRIMGHPTLEEPCFVNRELNSIVDVQFGPAYVFALAANGVRIGPEWYDMDTVRSQKIQEFAKKVSYKGHPDYGKQPINLVEVVAKGRTYRKEQQGGSRVKLSSYDEVLAKFQHNVSRILTEDKIERAQKTIMQLEKIENVQEMMELVTL